MFKINKGFHDEFYFDDEEIVRQRFGNHCCFDGGGGGGQTQVTPVPTEQRSQQQAVSYTPEQKAWLSKALELYGPALGGGQAAYPGDRLAPFTPAQQQALGTVPSFLEAFGPERGVPLFGETGETLRRTLAGETGAQPITPEQTGAYFKGTIEDPARAAYAKEVLPATREAFAGPGFWGSARAKAQQESGENLFRYLGEQKAGLDWNTLMANRMAEEQRAERMAGAVPMGLAYGAAPTAELGRRLGATEELFSFAGQEQAQQQAQINDAITRFAEQNRITDPENLQVLLTLLGLSYSSSAGIGPGFTTTSQQWGPGLGYSVLSAGAGGFATGYGSALGGA